MNNLKLFGTDGIRGTVGEYPLTEDMVPKIGYAAASWLVRVNDKPIVLIGRDTRESGTSFEDLLASGLIAGGAEVKLVGVAPTAALSYLVKEENADLGVVISASHNAASDNGIKFFDRMGYKLSDLAEEEIEKIIFEGQLTAEWSPKNKGIKDNKLSDKYLDFLCKISGLIEKKSSKIVIDCANGSVSHFAPKVFGQLTKKLITLNADPDGTNINHNCGSLYPEIISEAVKASQADIGFAFDGDGDRVIVVDEEGKILDGDYQLAIMSIARLAKDELPNRCLATTHMSNLGLDEALEKFSAQVLRTNVGDRNVADLMRKEGLSLGGEQSGHVILFDYSNTGDGLITALEFLKVHLDTGRKVSELADCLSKYPQQLVNIRVKNKTPINEIPGLPERIAHYQDEFDGRGRIFVRYSGTEPLLRIMIEARDEELLKQAANDLSEIVNQAIGS